MPRRSVISDDIPKRDNNKSLEQAKLKAEETHPNPNSKGHKRIKFKNAPAALLVYVSQKVTVKSARRKLFDAYGEVDENGNWPVLLDGSKMMFAPIIQGVVKNNEAFNNLQRSMNLQVMTKSDEIYLQLSI